MLSLLDLSELGWVEGANDAVASIGPRLTQTERKKKLRQKITSAKCAVQGVGPKHLNPGESRTAKLQTLDITQVHKYECNVDVDVRDLYPWNTTVGLAKRDFEFNSNERNHTNTWL